MNAQQRAELIKIKDQLETLKDRVDEIQFDEQEKFDNLSEGLQEAATGQALGEAADHLAEVASSLVDAINVLEDVV